MQLLRAILQLTRFDSSVLGFLCLFVPFYSRTRNVETSLKRSVPLLFIWICTFIANDLDDVERDEVNHPNRPLPSRRLKLPVAAMLYFASLALSLFSVRAYADERLGFWYYGTVALAISYGYVVEALPNLKAPFVAGVISLPLIIIAKSYPAEQRLGMLVVVGFLLALGRELCADIDDRAGDVKSTLHHIPATPMAIGAFGLQVVAWAMLLFAVRGPVDAVFEGLMTLLLLAAAVAWFRLNSHGTAKLLMKLEFLVGLYFLA